MSRHVAAVAARCCGPIYSTMNRTLSHIPTKPLYRSFNGCRWLQTGFDTRSSVVCSSNSIRQGEVHLWWMPIDCGSHREESYTVCREFLEPVDEAETLDIALLSGREAEVRGLVARAYLRHVLSSYTGVSKNPREIEFVRNEFGKPEMKNRDDHGITFNMTHSRGVVGVAVSSGRGIGIDVEAKERRTRKIDEMKLAKRYFSQYEIDMLAAVAPGEERRLLFVQLWTLKESYVKAIGRGIGASPGLCSFSFSLNMDEKNIEFLPSIKEPKYETPWSFTLLEPFPGYIGAVCSEPCTNMSMFVSPALTSCRSIDTVGHTTVQVPVLATT